MRGQTAGAFTYGSRLNIDLWLILYPFLTLFSLVLAAHVTWSAVLCALCLSREREMPSNWTLPAGHLCHLPEPMMIRDGLCK